MEKKLIKERLRMIKEFSKQNNISINDIIDFEHLTKKQITSFLASLSAHDVNLCIKSKYQTRIFWLTKSYNNHYELFKETIEQH